MTTIINGSSPSVTFSDGTTQTTAGLPLTGGTLSGGITFANGTLQNSAARVLQVVSNSASQGGAAVSTSNTSFVTTSISASITPLFSTSKILVLANGAMTQTGNSGSPGALATIYRGSTNLANGSTNGFAYYENSISSGFVWVSGAMQVLDSPATNTSTTYTIYLRAVVNSGSAGTAYYNINYAGNGLTLMEIAA